MEKKKHWISLHPTAQNTTETDRTMSLIIKQIWTWFPMLNTIFVILVCLKIFLFKCIFKCLSSAALTHCLEGGRMYLWLSINVEYMMHLLSDTHRQWTTVRPSPHSLCHLCTWASRLRKAFFESGTSRYADQRRNWNWHTTSWPSWSFRCNGKHWNTWIVSLLYCVGVRAHAQMCLCCIPFFWWFQCFFVCVPVNTHVWLLPRLRAGTLSCAHSAD